jgi:hypothetical protein
MTQKSQGNDTHTHWMTNVQMLKCFFKKIQDCGQYAYHSNKQDEWPSLETPMHCFTVWWPEFTINMYYLITIISELYGD